MYISIPLLAVIAFGLSMLNFIFCVLLYIWMHRGFDVRVAHICLDVLKMVANGSQDEEETCKCGINKTCETSKKE